MAIVNSNEKSPIDFSFVLLPAMVNSHKKSQAPWILAIAKTHPLLRLKANHFKKKI
jgi:hypothetical protein